MKSNDELKKILSKIRTMLCKEKSIIQISFEYDIIDFRYGLYLDFIETLIGLYHRLFTCEMIKVFMKYDIPVDYLYYSCISKKLALRIYYIELFVSNRSRFTKDFIRVIDSDSFTLSEIFDNDRVAFLVGKSYKDGFIDLICPRYTLSFQDIYSESSPSLSLQGPESILTEMLNLLQDKKGIKKKMTLDNLERVIHNAFDYFQLKKRYGKEELLTEQCIIMSKIINDALFINKSQSKMRFIKSIEFFKY